MSYGKTEFQRRIIVPLMAVLISAGLVTLSACDLIGAPEFIGSPGDSESARMEVRLVDNPFPFDLVQEVNVTISRVDLRGGEASFTVMTETETFNLLALQDGVYAVLGDIEIPSGEYNEVRLTVDDAAVVMKDGRTFDMKVPSGRVKVMLEDIVVEAGQDVNLTLDFDVSKSFVVQGNPFTPAGIKGFLLKPTVISKGLKENGRGDDDGDDDNGDAGDDDDAEDDGDDSDDEGDDADDEGDDADNEGDDDGSDDDGDEGDDADDEGDDDGDDDNGDDEGDDDGDDQNVVGVVSDIETSADATFITVFGLDLMIVAETEFGGVDGVEDLIAGETIVDVDYFQEEGMDVLIASEVQLVGYADTDDE